MTDAGIALMAYFSGVLMTFGMFMIGLGLWNREEAGMVGAFPLLMGIILLLKVMFVLLGYEE